MIYSRILKYKYRLNFHIVYHPFWTVLPLVADSVALAFLKQGQIANLKGVFRIRTC